jgi:hypothetical protein
MYLLIRKIHLFSGLVLAAGLFMYGFTGFVISHQDWFPGAESEKSTREVSSEVALSMPLDGLPKGPAHWQQQLAAELALRGRPGKHHRSEDGGNVIWHFEYARPGTVEKLDVRPGNDRVKLTLEAAGFAGTMNRLHHFHGYAGGPRFFVWGLFVDLASLAMILFPLSGIYLWYKIKKDHRLGWAVLGGSMAYGIGSIAFLVLGR